MKLDEVESRGEKSIREKRREIVKDIGKEVSRLDWYWKQALETGMDRLHQGAGARRSASARAYSCMVPSSATKRLFLAGIDSNGDSRWYEER